MLKNDSGGKRQGTASSCACGRQERALSFNCLIFGPAHGALESVPLTTDCMTPPGCGQNERIFSSQGRIFRRALWLLAAALLLVPIRGLSAQPGDDSIDDVTGRYHFISADDTLALLEEEGKLKGYIDVYQGPDESDEILSYQIVEGLRKKDHVEFRTNKIHRKYFRFTGAVERGSGHEEGDPDYLRLIGTLEIVTIKGESGEEAVQRMRLVCKSFGKGEQAEQ
jgi:hypothetical protein